MARVSAVERAAQAKARLDEANKAQAEIAQQALEALDNGADPELVAKLAEEAAKDIKFEAELTPVLREQQHAAHLAEAQAEVAKKYAEETMVFIELIDKSVGEGRPFLLDIGVGNGDSFLASFSEDGIASVPYSVAQFLLANFTNYSLRNT